jgi:histidinol-phosphate/aromatic aminotransferase/cobyric acid decarboxylase-like protein
LAEARATTRVHGGPDGDELRALRLSADEILDFSVNVNPFGAAPAMLRAIADARLDRYPDARAPGPLAALAAAWQVAPARLAVGNGAAELLWSLVQLVCRGGSLVVVAPAFCEPALAAQAADLSVFTFETHLEDGFAIDPGALVDFTRARNARALYLASPQNPTGRLVPLDVIAAVARALPDVVVLLDEAFLALSRGAAGALVALPENVVRIRSLTKEHALPGLRVGALIAPAELVARLEERRPAWTVSAPALAAVAAAATLESFVADLRARWLAETAAQATALTELGLSVLPSDTVFHLVAVGDAAKLRARLLAEYQILVRDCASFGLPAFVRVAGRTGPDRARLARALRQAL